MNDANDTARIMKRLDRKLELMKMDAKAKGDNVKHDVDECLALMCMLQRAIGGEQ